MYIHPREFQSRISFNLSLFPSTTATIYAAELTSRSNTLLLCFPPFPAHPTHITRLLASTPLTEKSKAECSRAESSQADRTNYQIGTILSVEGLVATLLSFHICM
jgi:hypothetical protein